MRDETSRFYTICTVCRLASISSRPRPHPTGHPSPLLTIFSLPTTLLSLILWPQSPGPLGWSFGPSTSSFVFPLVPAPPIGPAIGPLTRGPRPGDSAHCRGVEERPVPTGGGRQRAGHPGTGTERTHTTRPACRRMRRRINYLAADRDRRIYADRRAGGAGGCLLFGRAACTQGRQPTQAMVIGHAERVFRGLRRCCCADSGSVAPSVFSAVFVSPGGGRCPCSAQEETRLLL